MQTSSTTTQVYKNATVGGAEQGSSQFRNAKQITLADRGDAYSELATKSKMLFTMLDVDVASDKVLDGIGQTPSDASTWGLKGTMEELIIYNSDQTDDRFKIESNINNYYGLYNDANEFSGDPVKAGGGSGAITLSNVSKTGFTATIDATSGTKQINFPLLNSLVSGDDYFVSFDYTSTSTSTVGVKPRTDALGSASNDVISATNSGFYGGTGDSQHNGFDVNNTATILSFQTTAQSFTFTVSNLRASRIARNGFVETLYDQSSNGNDVDQGTAGSQPAIVQNGGQVKVGNRASIKFDGTDDFLERATYTQGELAQINTIFSVAKLDTYANENRKVYDGHLNSARNMLQLNPVGNGQFAHYAGSVAATGEDADTNQHLFTSRLNGLASRLYIDGVQKSTSDAGSFGMQGITIGANHDQTTNNCWKGDIQEIIVYNSDQNDDRANHQDDINNYYTIY